MRADLSENVIDPEVQRREDEFLAMLAHELRNPLAPIRNSLQLLNHVACADPDLTRAREVIDRQVSNLSRIVDDLLDASRVRGGKIELQRRPLDAAEVVERAVEVNRPLIEARRHTLTLALPPSPLPLEGDLTRLAQALGNLITNAAKYMDDGGTISVGVAVEGAWTVFRVKDQGVGISAAMLSPIFDLFSQCDRTIDRAQGGLGLGLTLARSLVHLHGGTIEAHSAGSGLGSEFVVRLPSGHGATVAREGEPEDRPPAPPAPAGRNVLVVDDNVDGGESLAMVLRAGGHAVRVVYDGLAALDAAAADLPDAVVLDIGLPKMDGYEVARRLRSTYPAGALFLIALTGYGQSEDRQRSREVGFNAHLVKPVDLDALFALLSVPSPAPGK